MTKAISVYETGGPEVLKWEDVEVNEPGEGQIRVRHTAVGLNLVETYVRAGIDPNPGLPIRLGSGGAGVVEAIGAGVTGLGVGQPIAYALKDVAQAHATIETRQTTGSTILILQAHR
ncbi:MAG: alcohol dehydrogenase catalytic domain-containing protein [Rhodospirillales bacterium]|jgi:NADPH2:quinone reductase|nr:hypothetical protein [Rhodospirillaceae bacterium]MDP6175700.1 alcohol dehydrogenase catalytic domain-containing protein [Rhodospirillales bacterium]|tara:strand:- start:90 stop:440 length:351 start_codon:yes stop_codon:yes gene_type:complete